MTNQDTIPVPTYLFEDEQLRDIVDRLKQIELETEVGCERGDAAQDACLAELAKRDTPVVLTPEGNFKEGKKH